MTAYSLALSSPYCRSPISARTPENSWWAWSASAATASAPGSWVRHWSATRCALGAYDSAYRLLTQRECPSWLYPVTMGATTVWERWDSMRPDGWINPGEMTSFNHYALGAIADWLHRVVAGLAPAAPGYRRLLIHPRPGDGLTQAGATHLTPYGRASVQWVRAFGPVHAHRDGAAEHHCTGHSAE